ncbi:MAG: hypothetical protein CMJ36_00995 [Phycisphaerae bacterium]|nr:hypothetical protein [Phycisphaerae bacterium]
MRDVVDIDTARSDVGCHQDRLVTRSEGIERLETCILRLVSMNGVGTDARTPQLLCQPACPMLRTREYKGLPDFAILQQLLQQLETVLAFDHERLLPDGVDCD